MNKLKQTLEKALKSEPAFFDSESQELNYTKVKDSADRLDEKLIALLADNKDLKNKFFTKIKEVYVFNTQDFKFFLDESKVDNSYTQYENKIGLSDKGGLLGNRSEVFLDFPFKDCILEGGQSTEEGTDTYFEYSEKTEKYEKRNEKRNEIFFNQVLARDEIDRLFDKKALINWRRFTKDSKKEGETVKEIRRDKTGLIQENMVIKGNNLLTLHSLESQFTGKIKLIYIDPPYNTQGDNNTFVYNNTFNHSAWLVFMRNRLEVAKTLLQDDGVICIAIDDEEYAHLKVLTDEVFGRENYIGTIIVQSNPRGRTTNAHFATTHEYALFYALDKAKVKVYNQGLSTEQELAFDKEDEHGKFRYLPFRRSGGTSTPEERQNSEFSLYYSEDKNTIVAVGGERDQNKNLYLPKTILTLDKDKNIKENNPEIFLKDNNNNNLIEIMPVDTLGKRRVWRWSDRKEILLSADRGDFNVVVSGDKHTVQLKDRIKDGRKPKTTWMDSKYDASSNGTMLLKNIFDGEKLFSYPKSLYTVRDTIEMFVKSNNGEIILDFFGGSGTTAHAVLDLNNEHSGNMRFIIVEQMDYVKTVTSQRILRMIQTKYKTSSFVYLELAKWNEKAKEDIQNAKDLPALLKMFDSLYQKYFLNYNLKINKFKEKIIKEENFKNLSLAQQKKIFLTMLDLNQMYVNESEMADKKYGISTEDQKLTKAFYSKK